MFITILFLFVVGCLDHREIDQARGVEEGLVKHYMLHKRTNGVMIKVHFDSWGDSLFRIFSLLKINCVQPLCFLF